MRCAYTVVRRKYLINYIYIQFIDYTKESLVAFLTNNPPPTKYSVIFDAADLIDPSLFTHLAPGGVFISTGPLPHGWKDIWKVIRTIGAITIPSWLGNVNRRWVCVRTCSLAMHIDRSFPLHFSTALWVWKTMQRILKIYQKNWQTVCLILSGCIPWNSYGKWILTGSLQPIVDSMFAFEDALKAYDRILTARAVGKVAIRVDWRR